MMSVNALGREANGVEPVNLEKHFIESWEWFIGKLKTDNMLEAEDEASYDFLNRGTEKEKLQELSVDPFMLHISMGY